MKSRSTGQPGPPWWRVVVQVFSDRDYRAITAVALLLGLESGVVIPFLALWVTRGLHGTTWQASFLYVPYGLVIVVSGLLMSIYSDRAARRRGLIIVSLLTSCFARIGMAETESYAVAIVLYAVTGFGPFGLLFALLRDTIHNKEGHGGFGASVTTLVRTMYSVGWLIGPVAGGLVLEFSSFRGMFFASAALLLIAAFWAALRISEQKQGPRSREAARSHLGGRHLLLLSLLFFVGVCLLSGNEGRASFLSLYLTANLHQPVSAVSWIFSLAIFSELVLIPVAGRLADRFGTTGVFTIGIATQAAYFLAMSAASAYWLILLLQVVYAFVVATVSGVGIVFAQSLMSKDRTALSTSTYLVSGGLAPLLNSLFMGIGAVAADLARLFAIFGILACLALLLVSVISTLTRREANTAA